MAIGVVHVHHFSRTVIEGHAIYTCTDPGCNHKVDFTAAREALEYDCGKKIEPYPLMLKRERNEFVEESWKLHPTHMEAVVIDVPNPLSEHGLRSDG